MYLLDKNDKEILKFNVNLGQLAFLGKEMRNVSIYHYPIIIFEFMTGYFTTEELYQKNKEISLEFTKDYEILELPKELTKTIKSTNTMVVPKPQINEPRDKRILTASSVLPTIPEQPNNNQNFKKSLNPDTKSYDIRTKEFKNQLDINLKNQIEMKNSTKSQRTMTITSTEVPVPKKEIKENSSKNLPIEKKKKLDKPEKKNITEGKTSKYQTTLYSEYVLTFQMLDYLINPKENIKETNPNFGKELEIFNDQLEMHKRKLRIIEMEKEIEFLTKKMR